MCGSFRIRVSSNILLARGADFLEVCVLHVNQALKALKTA
jgi:hypothetical protein